MQDYKIVTFDALTEDMREVVLKRYGRWFRNHFITEQTQKNYIQILAKAGIIVDKKNIFWGGPYWSDGGIAFHSAPIQLEKFVTRPGYPVSADDRDFLLDMIAREQVRAHAFYFDGILQQHLDIVWHNPYYDVCDGWQKTAVGDLYPTTGQVDQWTRFTELAKLLEKQLRKYCRDISAQWHRALEEASHNLYFDPESGTMFLLQPDDPAEESDMRDRECNPFRPINN